MPKKININENIKKIKEIFPELDIKKYMEWLETIKDLNDKDIIIKSFYEKVLEKEYEINKVKTDELLKLLEEFSLNTNEIKEYIKKTKEFIQNPEEIILSTKKELINFLLNNLKEINDKIINSNINDLETLEKIIKINEILLNKKTVRNKDINNVYEQLEKILDNENKKTINSITININEEIKSFNLLKYNTIVNYLPSWIIPTLFNPRNIMSSFQQLNLSLKNVYFNFYNTNNIFSLIQRVINLSLRVISLLTFVDKSIINRFLNSLNTIVSSAILFSGLIAYKEGWIKREDIIAMVLNAPKYFNLLPLPYEITAGSLENINYNNKTLKQHIINLIEEKEKSTFTSYGKLQFFYPFQDYYNKTLSEKIKLLSQQFIVIQFPPKIATITKQNNYNAITSAGRAEQLFSYGGGSNITTELKLSYVANCLIKEEQFKLLKTNNKYKLPNLSQFYNFLKNKLKEKYKNLLKFFNTININVEDLEKQIDDKYHSLKTQNGDIITKEKFVLLVLSNIGNIEYFNQLNKISVKDWSLIDIYIVYMKFLYLMYPYVSTSQQGNEIYIHPPLIKIKPNEQSLFFIDPPLLSTVRNQYSNKMNILKTGSLKELYPTNTDNDLSSYYIVNSISVEFPENMYDRNFDLPSQINVSMSLTRTEKNIYEYTYNLKNLIE